MAEAIVKMMHTPGDGPDEEYSRRFATRLARNLLTKRSQQVTEQSQQGPHSLRSPIINTPSYRPASVLVGREDAIRKLLARGYTYPRIAERYRVRVGAVQQYVTKHDLSPRRPRAKLARRQDEVSKLLQRGLTQAAIAERLGVTGPSLSQFIKKHQLKPA